MNSYTPLSAMPISYLFIPLFLLLTVDLVVAEERQPIELEPVVITASKIEEPLSEIPASIEVITRQDIKAKQSVTLDEALQSVTGLTIYSFGGADPWATVNLRGTDINQSIVMIDGIKINPPFSQIPNAGALLLSDVERVEVVKGSYSALYGSEAIGGVVNVITVERPGLAYSISGGTHKTFNSSLLYSGRYSDAAYTLGYERQSTAGFKFSGPFWNNTLLGKITLPLSPTSALQFSTNYWAWEKYDRTICCEIDGSWNITFIIDNDSHTREDNWLNSIQLTHYPTGWWDYNIKLSRYTTDSHAEDSLEPPTPKRPFPLEIDSDIQSERDIFEMQHNLYWGEKDIVTLGFQYTAEGIEKEEFGNLECDSSLPPGMCPSMDQPKVIADRVSRAIYLQNLVKIKNRFSFTAGARFENGPGFNNEFIPKVSALYVLPVTNTRLNISYGQGIRAPSLMELYHPVQGNTDLRPEKSASLEAGFKQSLIDGRIWLEATGFILRLKDLIDIDNSSGIPPTYQNIGRSKIEGVEATLRLNMTERLQGNIGYTRLATENRDSGEDLPFRPHYRWAVEFRYRPISQFVFNVNAEFVGESFNPFDVIMLPNGGKIYFVGIDGKTISDRIASYKVVNMTAAYNLIKGDPILGSLDFTLKLNNILGEDYVTLPEFRNDGFTFLAGIRSIH